MCPKYSAGLFSHTFRGLFHAAGDEADLARTQTVRRDFFRVHNSQVGHFVLFAGVDRSYFVAYKVKRE